MRHASLATPKTLAVCELKEGQLSDSILGDSGYVCKTQGILPAGGSHQASRSPTDRRRAK